MCVCVGGGGGVRNTRVGSLYYIYSNKKKPTRVFRMGGGGEAAGRTPYTFYKPTLGPKYVSNIPYNECITPTTII